MHIINFFSISGYHYTLISDCICLLFLVGIAVLLNKIYFNKTYTERKHAYKIKKAKEVIAKLATFEGDYRNARIIAYLRKIDAYVFEELLLCAFETKGFKITRNKKYSGDGGIDGMVVNAQKQLFYIQAKRYNKSISTAHIHAFSGLVNVNKAFGGYFIHTGKTPAQTLAKYKRTNITIISGSKLVDLIKSILLHQPQTNL